MHCNLLLLASIDMAEYHMLWQCVGKLTRGSMSVYSLHGISTAPGAVVPSAEHLPSSPQPLIRSGQCSKTDNNAY
jgi:hypothetical protein